MEAATTASVLGDGRFELRGTLGVGGAGTVYRAFDHQLQREVALKLLRQASGRDLYRFKREFRALADVVHPNLVALHELHAAEGDWYFTMDLVEGVSFIDWVRPSQQPASTGPRTRQDIVASAIHEVRLRGTLIQLVDPLIALHKAGKLHRDLKPSNVLVTPRGRLALLDFGLVASVAENHPDKLAVGTPVYMSPEQAADQPLTEASDWYSVGAMLYEALTGRRPFEGDSERVMTRKQTEQPRDPSELAPGVPADLARLCMTLLAPAPTARPTGFAVLRHLGAAPSQKTRDLARTSVPPSFVGRGSEIDELHRALADIRSRGVAVLVHGKDGIGKSTLVRRFLRGLGEQVFVLEGRCFEREQVPFKMLDGIVDMLTGVIVALPPAEVDVIAPKELAALVRLFPVMKRVVRFAELAATAQAPPTDPGELRQRGFDGLRTLLARLSKIRPVVLFVDDAHWGDADSTGFLAELVHQAEPQMLVILAHRPEDYLGVVARLKTPGLRRGDVRELEVTALPDGDAFALVAQFSADAGRARAALRAGAGNPLVLSEMARAPQLGVGATIADLIKARTLTLSSEALAMLAVSSIAARPLPVAIAAAAAGVTGGHNEALQLSVERLATLRRVDGELILQPAHDHVRQAVLAGLDGESRASWHEALARAFEDVQGTADVDAQSVVEHWLAAGRPRNAAQHAVAAAGRAEEALAFRRAAELYLIALSYGSWAASPQRKLLRMRGYALACAGQLDEAAAVYGHAAQVLVDDDEAVDLERLRVEALLRRGRLDEALPAANELLARIGIRNALGTGRTRLAAQWLQGKLRGFDFVEREAADCKPADLLRVDVLYSIVSGLVFADPALGRVVQAELLRAAIDCGEPVRVCLALAQEVCYAAGTGSRNSTAVDAVAARLVAVAARTGHAHLVALADNAIGIAAFHNGRWRDARDRLDAGLAKLREHGTGVRWEIDIGQSYWLSTLFYLGEWRELVRHGRTLLKDALDRGDVVAQIGIRSGGGSMVWLIAGRPDEARAELDAATAALPPGFALPHVFAIIAACNLDLYAGAARTAAVRLDEVWSELDELGVLRLQQLRVELVHLRARVGLSDGSRSPEQRAELAIELARELIAEAVPWTIGLGMLVRAAGMALLGNRDDALETLIAAEEQLAAAEMMGLLQICRLRRGLIEGGAPGRARMAAARDSLVGLGVADPERFAALLVPWPA